ncbi:MAG: T9SS type A sorting domain-containing protein [Adhaeribacter sp.]
MKTLVPAFVSCSQPEKKSFRQALSFLAWVCLLLSGLLASGQAAAQCTPASLNWDWQYKTNALSSPVRFGLGVNALTLSWDEGVSPAAQTVNGTFSGYGTGGLGNGRLAEFSVRNGSITIVFDTEVEQVKFALYDLDQRQVVSVSAQNASAAPQLISMSASNTGSRVSVANNNTAAATATGPNGSQDLEETTSGANVSIAGPVKTITLAFSKNSNGADPIWLSDISACVTGNYATGYQASAAPEAGQPDYVVASAANSVYAIQTSNAVATRLFTDATLTDINSLAYDPNNQVFFYADGAGSTANKSIYKYDLKTCSRSVLIADVTASPYNMALNTQGVGGGGAAFYNGSLFIGVDAGTAVTEDNVIWRIDLDAAGQATGAVRVFGVQANNGSTSLYNWGDFVIYDRVLYNFNSALAPAANTEIIHYDLNAQASTAGFTVANTGQTAVGYTGTVYNVTDGLAVYNKAGGLGAKTQITGGGWPTGTSALDGGNYFKFPADFGDAPASYGRPFHRFKPCASAAGLLQLGAGLDYEMEPAPHPQAAGDNGANYSGSGTANDEDGVSTFPALVLSSTGTTAAYTLTVAVRNTSGASRTLQGWIDFDGDGKFSATEYASAAVALNATSVSLTWPARAAGATRAGNTFARLRLTSTVLTDLAATPAEDERALSAAADGEVEDYALSIGLSIAGSVLRDANGLADNLVNGTGLGSAGTSPLYVYLVSGGLVADKAAVAANGGYTLSRASANASYTLVLSAASVALGAAAPALSLPAGWVAVGEARDATADALADGRQALTTGTAAAGLFTFGIQQLPVSANGGYAIPMPGFGELVALTAANELGPLAGSDPEDGLLGTGSRLVITSLAGMEGNELYYNQVKLAAGSVIAAYNPDLLAVKVRNFESKAAIFTFSFLDAAGRQSASPATYAMTWAVALPLQLIGLEVKKINHQVALTWATAMEENTLSFLVEHSPEGKNWTAIGSRPAAGNSTGRQAYAFSAPSPGKGTHYYRLKMIDQDGSFTYSPIKALQWSEMPSLQCYPNPVTDKLYLAGVPAADLQQVTLSDTRGNRVFASTGLAAGYLDLQHLPAGIYLLQVSSANSGVQTIKVVKR